MTARPAAVTEHDRRGGRARARSATLSERVGAFLDRPLASYYLVLGSAGMLVLLGLVMVLSASSVKAYETTGTPYGIFRQQVVWVLLGLPACWLGLRLRVRTLRRFAAPILIIAVLGMLMVLVPGVGVTVRGSTRWLDLGPLWLQPSEIAKIGLALWGADLLVRKERSLDSWKHLLVPLLPVGFLCFALTMLEPDLGTTLTMIIVVFALLFFVGAPMRMFGTLVAVMLAVVGLLIAVEPYRLVRVTSFLHPFADTSGSGYQAVQGIYSLANGGLFGVGLGGSSGKWTVPNAYTDYIFAIIGEELGLVGAIVVLLLFALFAYAGIRVAHRANDPFIRLVAGALTTMIIGQAAINIGYVVGLLPVTGIPLPLISFGGTALVLTMFLVGVLAGFARHEPAAAAAIRARPRTRMARLLRLPAPEASSVRVPAPRSAAARPPTAASRSRSGQQRAGAGRARPAQARARTAQPDARTAQARSRTAQPRARTARQQSSGSVRSRSR